MGRVVARHNIADRSESSAVMSFTSPDIVSRQSVARMRSSGQRIAEATNALQRRNGQ